MSIPLTIALLTYNRADYLEQAVTSILAQTYRNFELLILDNCSTDRTPQYVLSLNDPRIRYVRNPPNSLIEFNGVSAFHIARGDRLIITHDDDIMHPDMIAQQMQLMDTHPEVVAVWTNVSLMDGHGDEVAPYFGPPSENRLYGPGEYIASFLSERLWPVPSTMMLIRNRAPRRWIDEHYYGKHRHTKNKRNRNVAGTADVFLPACLNTRGTVAYIGKPLLKYRLHASQGTNSVELSTPSIHLYRALGRLLRRTSFGSSHAPQFDSYVARYQAQHTISNTQRSTPTASTRKRLASLLQRTCNTHLDQPAVCYPALPLSILVSQLEPETSILDSFGALPAPSAKYTTATQHFYQWQILRTRRRNLFVDHAPDTRITILGSAFVAALLILEAHEQGIQPICCLDSNAYRHGSSLLGVPIVPPTWLASHGSEVDLVLFSSEKDQEPYLERLVNQHLRASHSSITRLQPAIYSWKRLVAQAMA
ncbi:glycosyltransferase family 2 protein [Oryzomicrobium sp.]|uniref:glycosyltransferase family 2 protein n=1 Tax=Oryzomicrobium sp. TaxID=1911578 RepID=UPI002FE152DE